MNPFEMVVLIVAITAVAGVLKARYGRTPGTQADDPALANENRQLRDELRTLKERVAVLERIATERPDTLSREIEALRER